ncbi:MAG: ABC transporter permease [Candidatus Bathyarchaeia archaeon]
MIKFIIGRLLQYIATFLIVLVIIFAIPRMLPGKPEDYLIPAEIGSPVLKEQLMEKFGLNKSPFEQFCLFLVNVFRGDFGVSWKFYPLGVMNIIMERLPWTILLMVSARILSAIIAFLLGTLAAWKHGKKTDVYLQGLFILLLALPTFWIGLLLQMFFCNYIPIFPLGGSVTPGKEFSNFFEYAWDVSYHLFLPLIALTHVFGADALIMRNNMVDTLREDYILTAEAKGLKEKAVMFRHAARNALLPFITGIAISFGRIASGFILIEIVFSYPGMGLLVWDAISQRDFPLLQGVLILTTILVLATNFITDILYSRLDPRIRIGPK